ncbi:MAG: oligosaccharide flippase family protein [Clostridia bacterium]|nr:oligosaccharide flippase family protein [Clostridia bacterium]
MQGFRRFLANGLILTVTSLLMRGIGVAFNAFVNGKIGADGMGLFTLIMSVYGLAVTMASSGVNLAAVRMCAEAIGAEDDARLRASLRRCLAYAVICGTATALALYAGADWVAADWLGDSRCAPSLRLLALSLPFIAASNVLSGYFSAVRRVSKNAATQMFEQLFKIFVTVWALLYLVPDGIEYACMAIVGGGALAETASFTMALVLYLHDRHVHGAKGGYLPPDAGPKLTRTLFGITIPVAAAAYVRSGLTTLEHILIPRGLRANPLTADTALATYGVLCGMVMPVIMFPTAFLYSFTGLLVPEFAEANSRADNQRIGNMTSRAMSMTLFYSVGCAEVMSCFSHELGMLIYQSSDAGLFIRIMAPLIPVMYLDHCIDAILKGMGEQLYSMKVNILDAALCTLLVWLLCPRIGIWGYVLTVYLSELVNASLSLARLLKVCDFQVRVADWLLKPLVCVSGAISLVRLGMDTLGWGMSWPTAIVGMTAAALLYTALLAVTGGLRLRGGYRSTDARHPRRQPDGRRT